MGWVGARRVGPFASSIPSPSNFTQNWHLIAIGSLQWTPAHSNHRLPLMKRVLAAAILLLPLFAYGQTPANRPRAVIVDEHNWTSRRGYTHSFGKLTIDGRPYLFLSLAHSCSGGIPKGEHKAKWRNGNVVYLDGCETMVAPPQEVHLLIHLIQAGLFPHVAAAEAATYLVNLATK
jgi:hypothetical protein